VTFINDLNATWIRAAERLSTRVLSDLYARRRLTGSGAIRLNGLASLAPDLSA